LVGVLQKVANNMTDRRTVLSGALVGGSAFLARPRVLAAAADSRDSAGKGKAAHAGPAEEGRQSEREAGLLAKLSGQVAIVTGGGSGIGAGIALELARRGASIALMGRTPASLEMTA